MNKQKKSFKNSSVVLQQEPIDSLSIPIEGNLIRGDAILSYGKPRNLVEKIAHRGIEWYQEKLYPGGNNSSNHIRVYLGKFKSINPNIQSDGVPLVFEWTFPISKITTLKHWMLWPEYAEIYRNKNIILPENEILTYALNNSGKIYDAFQLIGIALNINIGFGKNKEVCSTGARKLYEFFTGKILFPEIEVWRTPPSAWANNKEWIKIDPINNP